MDVKARVSSGDELLNEKFTIPSIITTPNPIDFNTYTKPGIYYLGSHSEGREDDANFINSGPIGFWGTLIVSGTLPHGTPFQIFIEDIRNRIYHRYIDLAKSTETNYVWKDWTIINDEESTLNKAFPVGFNYITAASKPVLPSFGTWTTHVTGYVASTTNALTANFYAIYTVTRTA
jgi:hypothetical protein